MLMEVPKHHYHIQPYLLVIQNLVHEATSEGEDTYSNLDSIFLQVHLCFRQPLANFELESSIVVLRYEYAGWQG